MLRTRRPSWVDAVRESVAPMDSPARVRSFRSSFSTNSTTPRTDGWLFVTRGGRDIRPTKSGKVDCVDRKMTGQFGNETLKIVELRSQSVKQQERRTGPHLEVS